MLVPSFLEESPKELSEGTNDDHESGLGANNMETSIHSWWKEWEQHSSKDIVRAQAYSSYPDPWGELPCGLDTIPESEGPHTDLF